MVYKNNYIVSFSRMGEMLLLTINLTVVIATLQNALGLHYFVPKLQHGFPTRVKYSG